MKTHYTYSVDGFCYWLVPVFKVTKSGFVRVIAADMYAPNLTHYYGTWERYNMPIAVIRGLESYCRLAMRHSNAQEDENERWRPI